MPDICLQFGQCGNQIGSKFLEAIHKNEKENLTNWFRSSEKGEVARCVLVDTENKVINELLGEKRKWSYERRNAVSKSGGSGNNWALGYCVNGPDLGEEIFEKLRLECEQSDFVRSIITFSSAGGGTGSGVGTYVIDKLQDLFPSKYIINNLTIPSLTGTSPVHLYNTVLTLSHLTDSSDAIVAFYNDFLFNQCAQLYKESEFKFSEMNSIISKQLCSLFHSYNGNSFIPYYVQKLVPNPNFKLLSMKSFPYVKDVQMSHSYEPLVPWKSIIDRLKSLIVKNSENFWDSPKVNKAFTQSKQNSSVYYRSLGNLVMCRGKGSINAVNYAKISFNNDALYSELSQEADRFSCVYDNTPIHGQQQFSCIATNSAIFNHKIESIIDKSWNSFMKNAYLHHYEKYGLHERDFSVSFLKTENLLEQYKSL